MYVAIKQSEMVDVDVELFIKEEDAVDYIINDILNENDGYGDAEIKQIIDDLVCGLSADGENCKYRIINKNPR